MPTLRAIGVDALTEIGVLSPGETMSAEMTPVVVLRAKNMIDAWQAERLTLAIQQRTVFTLTSGTSTVTLGPTGGTVTMQRPVWIDTVNYIVPSTSPQVESPIAIMGRDQYATLSMKFMQSSLPTQCFYQTSLDTVLGSLFFWPQVTQNVQIALYAPQGFDVPTSLDTILTGPPGYQDAFMYQLALRLLTPFGVSVEDVPLLAGHAKRAFDIIKRVNTMPGLLGIDPALSPTVAGGYNVLTDNTNAPGNR